MPFDLALVDLVRPYILRGETTPWHAVLSVIYVESYETATSPAGIVIRGIGRFSGDVDLPTFDPSTGTLTAGAANQEGHPRNQPNRTEPWLDVTDSRVEFSLTVPRAAGAIIVNGVNSVPGGDATFQAVRDVLDALDPPPINPPPSDYPNTGFTLDLVLAGIELRPPFLKPAEMRPDGLLIPHSSRQDVVFNLPKIKLHVTQGIDAAAQMDVCLVSLGASGLDDPGALDAAELITMEPHHAFIGDGQVVGFGFRSAYLDLSQGYTPPEVLSQFGFDEAWTGLYLPEVRIFFAPNGAEDFAVNAGVENLLIGLGNSSGLTGDFDVAVINQGSGDLVLGANFFTSDGRGIGIIKTGNTATAVLPEMTRMAVDVRGGRAPYSVTVDQGSGPQAGVVHDVTIPASGTKTITIAATDASAPQKQATLTITASRRPTPSIAPPPGEPLPARIATTSIMRDGQSMAAPALRLLNDNRQGGQIRVDLAMPSTPSGTEWIINGGPPVTGASVDIPLVGGDMKSIEARLPDDVITSLKAYFRFDTPPKLAPPTADPITYSRTRGNIRHKKALFPNENSGWEPGAEPFNEHWDHVLSRISPRNVTIEGTASIDNNANNSVKAQYNWLLSQRRAAGLEALLNEHYSPQFVAAKLPAGVTYTVSWRNQWSTQGDPRPRWWNAEIRDFSVNLPGAVITGTAERDAVRPPPPPPVITDQPPSQPSTPDWFRSARLKVRIVRDQFVALELSGQIDFQTGMESMLQNNAATSAPSLQGLGNNPSDGITDFLFLYQTDPASQSDEVKLYIGADPADKDGLLKAGALPTQTPVTQPNLGLNLLGMTMVFTPLLSELSPDEPSDGSVAALAVTGAVVGVATGLAQAGFLTVERVVLFGGEGAFRRQGDLWQVSLLFDVETAISMDVELGGTSLIEIPRTNPLTVRYKAIGLSFGQPPGGGGAFQFRPVFDKSKGYSIDLSGSGAVRVADPLGQILQVLGARIARTNPMTFEIDLGFAVDLGVVSIERARVRLPVSPLGPPELTAFKAGLKVPGVIEGTGYMELNNSGGATEIKGMVDVRLVPVKMRIAAGLAVANIPESEGGPATGVAVTLEIELPVAIPLAASGFGIYGFTGLFAMHYARNEDGISSLTPALDWLKNRAQGSPTNLDAWKTDVDSWAFGAGILLGTMGSPIIFNVKGMFILELPGPRVLLMVKANLLAAVPGLKDKNAEGTFLCVIDLDFGRETLSIGLSIDFEIDPLVEIQIPIEAFFDLKKPKFWHVYLGSFTGNDLQGNPLPGPIRASILGVFDGSGYVMFSGHGIPSYSPGGSLPSIGPIQGFGIGAGLEVSIIWGNTSINLYLKVTAGFNAILGFQPFYVGGVLYLRGELKLFIISLSASAALSAQVGEKPDGSRVSRIDGEVCGELDLFFFTIKGCVDFHIGEESPFVPGPPDLFNGAALVSRSPALVEGTGVDRGIDNKIADLVKDDAATPPSGLPVVPIDAIPVITMDMPPVLASAGVDVLGETPGGSTGAPTGGFNDRGGIAYKYELQSITIERFDADNNPATDIVLPGNKPSTFWAQEPVEGENLVCHLSVLNWRPNPTPKAFERSEVLEETVRERWGTVCDPAAPAAPVLWTFHEERLGPSPEGWDVDGVAWPDPPDTRRSSPPDGHLHIHETWRTGDIDLDKLRGIIPAIIEGGLVNCAPDFSNTGDAPPQRVPARIPAGQTLTDLPLREELAVPLRQPSSTIARGELSAVARQPAIAGLSLGDGTLNSRLSTLEAERSDLSTLIGARARRTAERARVDAAVAGSFGGVGPADTLTAEKLNLSDAAMRIELGLSIDRSALLSASSGLAASAVTNTPATGGINPDNPDGPRCPGRVLASPLWDTGKPVVFGDRSRSDEVADRLAELGHKHGPLSDVIEVDSEPFIRGHILMWVNRGLLNDEQGTGRGMMIHYLDDDGNVLGVRPVKVSDLLAVTSLPARWIDVNGPWFEDVYHAVLYGQTRLSPRQPVCVKLEPPDGTTRFRVGVLYLDEKQAWRFEQEGRPYYIGAIELTRWSEADRESWDTTEIEKDRKVLETFLSADSADVAMLFPNSSYRVTLVNKGVAKDSSGNLSDEKTEEATFWFRTDNAPPARLDPWLLCTLPAEGESHVFGHDNPRLVFATNNVDALYAAYGKELRIRVKAASFRQVDEPGATHPIPINPTTLENVKATVLSPFEAVLLDVLKESGPCVNVDEDRVRHSLVEIPIPLDPYTDYIIDIESVDFSVPVNTVGDLVYRLAFSTGQFSTVEHFAIDFQATVTEHRAVSPGVLQAIGNDPVFASRPPQGPEFDNALIDAGLEPMEVPEAARIVVFWEQANPAATPQPAAVLIDSSEPMSRTRPLPQELTETDPDGIEVKRWRLEETPWLDIEESSASDNIVDKIVFAPGRQRALVTLKPGARGKVLRMDLVRTAFSEPYLDEGFSSDIRAEIVAEPLDQAPWEET
ncbi:MAG: hypothetical protein AAF557_02165 [Pseudomonadota bacterium]